MKNRTKPERNTDRLIRLSEVLEIIPVSASTWWEGVRTGRYPPAIKIGPRLTCWRLREVLQLAETGTW